MIHFRKLEAVSIVLVLLIAFPFLAVAGQYQVVRVVDRSLSLEDFPCSELYEGFPVLKSGDPCKNLESRKLELINVTKTLFGF